MGSWCTSTHGSTLPGEVKSQLWLVLLSLHSSGRLETRVCCLALPTTFYTSCQMTPVFFCCIWSCLVYTVLSWGVCGRWGPGDCMLACLHQDSYHVWNARECTVKESTKCWLHFASQSGGRLKMVTVTWDKLFGVLLWGKNLFVANNCRIAPVYISV